MLVYGVIHTMILVRLQHIHWAARGVCVLSVSSAVGEHKTCEIYTTAIFFVDTTGWGREKGTNDIAHYVL